MARPRNVSDEEILAAARSCFLAHGPAVPTTRIADEVGVSQAVLFKRFGTKEELMVRALAPPAVPDWLAMVDAGPDDRPVREQLMEIGATVGSFLRDLTPCVSILRASGVDLHAVFARYEVPPPVLGHKALSAWFARAMEAGLLRRSDPDAAAFMLLGSFQVRVFMQHVVGYAPVPSDGEVYAASVVEVLWKGLCPGEGA